MKEKQQRTEKTFGLSETREFRHLNICEHLFVAQAPCLGIMHNIHYEFTNIFALLILNKSKYRRKNIDMLR